MQESAPVLARAKSGYRIEPGHPIITFKCRSETLQVLNNRHEVVLGVQPIRIKSNHTRTQHEQLVAVRTDSKDCSINWQRDVSRVSKVSDNAGQSRILIGSTFVF